MPLRRSLSVAAKIMAGFLLAVVAVLGWLAVRLANDHPIHLRFLVPTLQRSLATADQAIRFELDDIVFAWVPGVHLPGLSAIGLRGYAKDGHLVAEIGKVGFSISLAALAHGLLAPAAIEVLAPAINLRREADGEFKILGMGGSSQKSESQPIGREVLDRLSAPPDPNRITGYLREIRITGGSLVFDDRETGRTFHAVNIDLDLIRRTEGIHGRLSARLHELGNLAIVNADVFLGSATRSLELKAGFHDIDVPSLASIHPILAGLRVKIDGRIETSLAEGGVFGDIRFDLSGGPGSIDLPKVLAGPVDISGLSIAGRLEAGFDRLAMDALTLDLGASRLEARAQVSGLAPAAGNLGKLRVKANADIRNLPISEVPRLWPLSGGQSTGARDWFTGQVYRGTVEHAQASLDLAFAGGDPAAPQVLAFDGGFDATGVGLYYLKRLPPIEGAAVTAHFDASRLVVDVQSGDVGKLKIQKARVTIAGLDGADQSLDLEGDVNGPLRDALLLLDDPGLGYLHGTGIKPAESEGKLSAHMRLRFPLLKDLPLARVSASAKVRIEEAKLDNVLAGQDLSGGAFAIDLDEKGFAATGRAIVAGVPVDLQWDQNFGDRDPKTRLSARARPDAQDLARLGLDLHGAIQGPVPGELVYRRFATGPAELAIDADLTPATITLDFARWYKAAGMPGQARAALELDGLQPRAISAFSVKAGDFAAEGQGQFTPEGRLREVTFDRITVGKTRLNAVVLALGANRVDAKVGSGEFDAEPYLSEKEYLGLSGPSPGAGTSAGPSSTLAYALEPSHLDRVLLGAGREIDSLRLSFAYDGSRFQSIDAGGRLLGGGSFALGWLPADASTHRLSVEASDAGAALKALGIFDDAAGGRLTVSGTSQDDAPGRPIVGHIEISEYRLLRQSALLRLFSIATLTGVADMMTGNGLLMRRFLADFKRTYGRVDVPLARTYGPSLGITAKGYFDLSTDSIDIRGTVVPANALNSLVGKIPLIGFLLTGGRNNGIGSFTYKATGRLSEPSFSVNPLSALDPGFLRAIFDLPNAGGNQLDALPPGAGGQ